MGGSRARSALGGVAMSLAPLRHAAARRSTVATAALVALVVLVVALADLVGVRYVAPAALLSVVVMVGGLLLDLRALRWLLAVTAGGFGYDLAAVGSHIRPGGTAAVAVAMVLAHEVARSRERLGGLSSEQGQSMLLDLREQLQVLGQIPRLPSPWSVEVAQRSAGGASFGGDFILAALHEDVPCLELVVVDVSGKGLSAGTRALTLSGAMSGLLGAVPAEEFLRAANDYLLRQHWHEGFATAVHVRVALESGEYRVASAGHPPVAHYSAGSGRWRVTDASGPVLGVLSEPEYLVEEGVLRPHDALILYTDGLVEVPGRDLSLGIDKLLGVSERLVSEGYRGGARKVVDAIARKGADDRALVLLWRD